MSRIDDDGRDAARLAEKIAQQRRTEEQQKKDKAAQDSAFSRLVGQQKTEKQKAEGDNVARSAIAHLLEQAESLGEEKAQSDQTWSLGDKGLSKEAEARLKGRQGGKALEDKLKAGARGDADRATETKLASDRGDAAVGDMRNAEHADGSRASEGRGADAKVGRDSLDAKRGEQDASKTSRAGGARGEKGELKADADKGGQGGQQGGGKDDKGAGAAAAGFRFNPALMAPVPVAKKNEVQGSDRLRRIATELAQKIVERVRVGTNAAGAAEFQIDLKGDVLAGLKMKISAKNGRISAVFQGSDKDVLKMIEEQGEALKGALTARGLSLEQLKTEFKA